MSDPGFDAVDWSMLTNAMERYVGRRRSRNQQRAEQLLAYCRLQFVKAVSEASDQWGELGDGTPPAGGEREPYDPLAALDQAVEAVGCEHRWHWFVSEFGAFWACGHVGCLATKHAHHCVGYCSCGRDEFDRERKAYTR